MDSKWSLSVILTQSFSKVSYDLHIFLSFPLFSCRLFVPFWFFAYRHGWYSATAIYCDFCMWALIQYTHNRNKWPLRNNHPCRYKIILENIKTRAASLNLGFSPDFIMKDYETAALNSVRAILPETTLKGCLFHWGQSIWRQAVVTHKLEVFLKYFTNFIFIFI